MLKKSDLLLRDNEVPSRTMFTIRDRLIADKASLKTSIVIRDALNQIDKSCVDTKQVDNKFQWMLHDLNNVIKELENGLK